MLDSLGANWRLLEGLMVEPKQAEHAGAHDDAMQHAKSTRSSTLSVSRPLAVDMAPAKVLVVATGGTIFQKATQAGSMQLGITPAEFLENCSFNKDDFEFEVIDLQVRSGAELTWETVFRIHAAVASSLVAYAGQILVTGTDTLDECAFALSLLLDGALRSARRALVITGAMKPTDQLGFDGVPNFVEAVKIAIDAATCEALGSVAVAMNNDIHLGRYVFKGDSQLIGAFRSHPGPIGQFRSGRPVLYYQPPPPTLSLDGFGALTPAVLRSRVAIWTLTAGAFLPQALLEGGDLDGLVLAGPGTGSLPQAIVEQLSPAWTSRLPIVIVSRCQVGQNFDDDYYKGSREKYESRGFVLRRGYEHLNALQARTLLIFRLSALGHA